jgi:anti-sigma regulatory factor (Ser/Thr protein kinase)
VADAGEAVGTPEELRGASLALPPDPEHVRTARLVAVAAARRLSVDEQTVDDVRLVVGELVTRAVLRHLAAGLDDDVLLELSDADGGLLATVLDRCPDGAPEVDEGVALALVRAVAPHTVVEDRRAAVRWPA